jgi:ABC-type dipeptide/oligopeptide/nickel transport system ATPase component
MPWLDVSELSVSYQGRAGAAPVRAVERVSFSMEPGEVLALVGESGSGKSTIALALTRLLPQPPARVQANRLVFDGQDVLAAPPDQLRALRGRDVAYVFQDPATSLNPVLTVGEQLREVLQQRGRVARGEADRQAALRLESVGIPDAARRLGSYSHELSGGMQQRVMIAMALAAGPKLLIADEPTTALDVTVQVQILRLLRDLQRRLRLALLLVSHDLLVVERVADRVAILTQGRLVETGPVAQVFRQPAHPATRELLAARPASLRSAADGGAHA